MIEKRVAFGRRSIAGNRAAALAQIDQEAQEIALDLAHRAVKTPITIRPIVTIRRFACL
jgi:hypothetical protein